MKKEPKLTNYIEQIWAVLCTNSSIDQISNNVSLFNVIEQVNVNIPKEEKGKDRYLINFPLELVILTQKKYSNIVVNASARVKIIDPSNNILFTTPETSVDYKKGGAQTKRNRSFFKFGNFPITTAGVYYFVGEIKDTKESEFYEICRIPLELVIN